MKSFRIKNDLTQEALSHVLGVDVRTIRRWEAGSSPSSTHVKKFTDILMPSSDHRLAANIKPLLEVTGDVMIAFDQDYRVLRQSRAHRALMHQLWGEDDLRGVRWMESKYVPERVRLRAAEQGGGRGMFKNGFVSTRIPFIDERSSGVVNAGRVDATYLRLIDGPVILNVTHRNLDPVFLDEYVRPWIGKDIANGPPDAITTLDH